jgi:capsular polysaccharide biosynthesis protein
MINLSDFIESKYPQCHQFKNNQNSDYTIDYFFSNEPPLDFNLIPKTFDYSIHPTIHNYLTNIKQYRFNAPYVSKVKDFRINCYNDVGAIKTTNNQGQQFIDLSTRYQLNGDIDNEVPLSNAILLALDSGSNYFHWMCQILPRIKLLLEYKLEFSNNHNIIIPEIRGSFVQETLSLLGIRGNLIECKKGTSFHCEDLIIPSKPNNHIYISQWSISFLRDLFISQAKTTNFKKILILRKESFGRNIANADELVNKLSSRGYQPIYLEGMSVIDQISLFHNATHIVAAHGASLANLIFCQPNTKIFELFNPFHFHCLYWNMSNSLNLDYHYMISPNKDNIKPSSNVIDKNQDIDIDIDLFLKFPL